MDRGTDARNMIMNKEIPLRLGYVGVKGRSQEDINNKMSVKDSLVSEQNYFDTHAKYKHMKDFVGTQNLIRKLTTVMYTHIKNVLPEILREINSKIKNCEDNIKKLGEPIPEDNKEKLDAIWRDISQFYDKFKSNIKGEYLQVYDRKSKSKKMQVLASAQIHNLFNGLYKKYLYKHKGSKPYSDSQIKRIIEMYTGNTLPGFVSVDCFVAIVSPLLEDTR